MNNAETGNQPSQQANKSGSQIPPPHAPYFSLHNNPAFHQAYLQALHEQALQQQAFQQAIDAGYSSDQMKAYINATSNSNNNNQNITQDEIQNNESSSIQNQGQSPLINQAQSAIENELTEEQAGIFKEILGVIGMNDKEFWKGALVGAAAVLLLNNDKFRDSITGIISGAGGLLKNTGSNVKETAVNTASNVKENMSSSSDIFRDTYKAGKEGFTESVNKKKSKNINPDNDDSQAE